MRRIPIILIISFIAMAFLFGCSSGNNAPVNPIMPDEQVATGDRTLAEAASGNVSTNFWNSMIVFNEQSWIASLNPNGTVGLATGKGVEVSSNPFEVINNHPELFFFGSDNFRKDFDEVHGNIRYVIMRQLYQGLRVWPSRVDFRYGNTGKLVALGADVYPDVNVDTNPTVSLESAKNIVMAEIGNNEPFEKSELVVFAAGDSVYQLAWKLNFHDWGYWVDAHNGSVLKREHFVWDAFTGNITAMASQADPLAPEMEYTVNNLELRMRVDPNDGYPTYAMPITDLMGNYYYVDATYTTLDTEIRFYGPYGNCNNQNDFPNNEAAMREDTYNDVPATFHFDDSSSVRSERTGWVWINAFHDFLKGIEPSYDLLDFVIQINVNNEPWCNAYASGDSINFFQSDGSCLDTGEVPDVVVHEYGHTDTFVQYGDDGPDGSIHEGFADVAGNLMTQNHYVGYNIQGQGTYFRDSKNNYMWPFDECGGEGHCLGQLLAGAYWDMYEYLGRDYMGYLYHFSRYGRPQTFPECAFELMLVDDDDDDWTNGTPNYEIIYECFKTNHNIDVPAVVIPEGINIDVVPHSNPVHIGQAGGSFMYDLSIDNDDTVPNSFHIWAEVQFPGGGKYGPFVPPGYLYHSPYYLTFNPGQSMFLALTQNVPANLPPGTYTYKIKTGIYPNADDEGNFPLIIDP